MTAPYRADHVGSLLRPEAVQSARKAHFEDHELDQAGLAKVEDTAEALRQVCRLMVLNEDPQLRREAATYLEVSQP